MYVDARKGFLVNGHPVKQEELEAKLKEALSRAWKSGCYKAMLLTGSKRPETHRFYEQCGFELIPDVVRRNDHVVMKLWIDE